ncbi:MAG: phosphate ABC transporter permease subunit PstC [Acidimicrobiales bacterium]
MSVEVPERTERPPLTARQRAVGEFTFRYLTLGSGLLVLVVLALIAVATTDQALPVLRHNLHQFLFSKIWNPQAGKPQFGALGFVFGTVVSSAIALVLAVPVSVGIALFLSELAPRGLRRPVTFLVDLLAAVPSVVFGLWGVLVLAPWIRHVYARLAGWAHPVPGLRVLLSAGQGGGGSGRSFFTAGIILALMITPIVTALTREIYDTTPAGQKEAALALGATRWEMIRGTIFPHSRAGFVGAVLLGLGRALGETIAAALVIGSSVQVTGRLFSSGDSMAAVIANQFGEATDTFRAALIGLGVLLFVITIFVNLVARAILGRTEVV